MCQTDRCSVRSRQVRVTPCRLSAFAITSLNSGTSLTTFVHCQSKNSAERRLTPLRIVVLFLPEGFLSPFLSSIPALDACALMRLPSQQLRHSQLALSQVLS